MRETLCRINSRGGEAAHQWNRQTAETASGPILLKDRPKFPGIYASAPGLPADGFTTLGHGGHTVVMDEEVVEPAHAGRWERSEGRADDLPLVLKDDHRHRGGQYAAPQEGSEPG